MEYVKSFRDLEVYKLARQTSKEIFEMSKKFPKEEMYHFAIKPPNNVDELPNTDY